MAIKISTTYSGRTDNTDPNYPWGKGRNVVGGVEGTGTPFEADWYNNLEGFLQGLLLEAEVTPNGDVDNANSSQLVEAVKGLGKSADKVITSDGRNVQERLDDLPSEVDAAGTAATLIEDHNSDAGAHPELSDFITSEANRATEEADRAESNANSTSVAANVYGDTTEGLAKTVVDEQFQVLSADGSEYIRYKHDAGDVATEVGRFPSASSVDSVKDDVSNLNTVTDDLLTSTIGLYESDSGRHILSGAKDENGNIQVLLSYDDIDKSWLNGDYKMLDESSAGDYLSVQYQSIESQQNLSESQTDIVLLAVENNNQTQSVLSYDIESESLVVGGSKIGSLSPTLKETRLSYRFEDLTLKVFGFVGSEDFSQSLTLNPNNTETVTLNTTLIYSADKRWYANPNEKLEFSIVDNVVVTRDIDSEVLTEGVDYELLEGGKINGLVDTADFSVTVNYDGVYMKYVTVLYDNINNSLVVRNGTERKIDPQEYMYQNATPYEPIFNILVSNRIMGVTDLQGWYGVDYNKDNLSKLRERNRGLLRKFIGATLTSSNVTIIGYGDSITALTGNVDHTVPNGTARDNVNFFNDLPLDTWQTIERFDFGDGGGDIHVKKSWNWQLVTELENNYGCTVNYLNYGIGGTTSENSLTGGGRLNGLYPDRLQYPIADSNSISATGEAVLTVIGFGMNELGSDATGHNVAELARDFKNAGSEVVVMGVPRPNPHGGFGGNEQYASWIKTNELLYSAAVAAGAAFIPTITHFSNERLGYAAIDSYNLAASGRVNHAGLREFDYLSNLLIQNIL